MMHAVRCSEGERHPEDDMQGVAGTAAVLEKPKEHGHEGSQCPVMLE